jgi:hypothetical protein
VSERGLRHLVQMLRALGAGLVPPARASRSSGAGTDEVSRTRCLAPRALPHLVRGGPRREPGSRKTRCLAPRRAPRRHLVGGLAGNEVSETRCRNEVSGTSSAAATSSAGTSSAGTSSVLAHRLVRLTRTLAPPRPPPSLPERGARNEMSGTSWTERGVWHLVGTSERGVRLVGASRGAAGLRAPPPALPSPPPATASPEGWRGTPGMWVLHPLEEPSGAQGGRCALTDGASFRQSQKLRPRVCLLHP